jgi:hypothetical protein
MDKTQLLQTNNSFPVEEVLDIPSCKCVLVGAIVVFCRHKTMWKNIQLPLNIQFLTPVISIISMCIH